MTNPKNPDLYQALKEYFKAACAYLSAKFESPEDLANAIEHELFSWPPYPSLPCPPPEDFQEIEGLSRLLRRYTENFERKGGYRNVIEVMEKDDKIKKYFNARLEIPGVAKPELDGPKQCLESALPHFLKRSLDHHSSLEFDESTFDDFYKEVEDFFYEGTVQYRWIAPLNNFHFRTDRESFSLEEPPNLSVIKISKQKDRWAIEYEDCYKIEIGTHSQNPEENAPPGTREETYEVPPAFRAAVEINKVCFALRLFKKGAVGSPWIWGIPRSWTPLSFTSGAWVRTLPSAGGEEYILQENEVQKFVEFWKWFRFSKFWEWFVEAMQTQQRWIEIAFERFHLGYQRGDSDDKLVDWMIAFEALLLKRDERGELSYRLALRASRLLGRDLDERKEIFEALRKAYDRRSDIVHGAEVKISELGNLVSKVEDYLRSAIIEFIKRVEEIESKPHAQGKRDLKEQILKALDDQIARGDCSIPPNQDEEG